MASADFNNYHGPPPGQGHYPSEPSYPASGQGYGDYRDGDRDRASSRRRSPPRQHEPYFDPPPTHERDYPPSEDYGPYDRPPPASQQFADYAASPVPDRPYTDRGASRPYAPSDPGPHEGNQMAPYDADKAEAEWNRGVNDAYAYQRPNRRQDHDDRTAYDDRSLYDDPHEDDRDYYDYRGRDERERRKRRDEEALKEKALRYPTDPKKGGRDFFGASEGERGFGAKLLGGAGGALIAHEVTKGKGSALKTLSGALVGALAADVAEKQFEKRRTEKALQASRAHAHDPYTVGYPQPGRDMEDVRRTGRDGMTDLEDRPHPRTRSRTRSRTGFRDRLARSLSRARSRSMSRRRRRDSEDSFDSASEYSHRR